MIDDFDPHHHGQILDDDDGDSAAAYEREEKKRSNPLRNEDGTLLSVPDYLKIVNDLVETKKPPKIKNFGLANTTIANCWQEDAQKKQVRRTKHTIAIEN